MIKYALAFLLAAVPAFAHAHEALCLYVPPMGF